MGTGKKKKPLNKVLIVASFCLAFELVFSISYLLKNQIIKTIQEISFLNFTFDTSQFEYTQPEIIDNQKPKLATLAIFPPDYDSLTKYLGDFTPHKKTQLLRYSQTYIDSKYTTLSPAYIDIYTNNFNLLVPQPYINAYFLNQIADITKEIKEKAKNQKMLEELERVLPEQNLPPNTEVVIPEATYTGNIYWDTDLEQLYKTQFSLKFLKEMYRQTKIENTKISNEIDTLIRYNEELLTYSLVPEAIPPTLPISQILNLSNLDISTQGDIFFLAKSVSTKDNINTYIAPTYLQEDLAINDNNFHEPYDIEPIAQSQGSTRVPIFMYHQIGNPPKGSSKFTQGLYITPEQFEEQMAYLVKNNYKTINSLELYNLLKKGGNPKQKTVMITFDDGTSGQYKYAYPILKKYGLMGVFNIVSNNSSITAVQLKEMATNGMEIASHTATHPNLVDLKNLTQMTYEISASKSILAARTGKPVYAIAYPGCVANSEAYSRVSSAGYLIGMSCGRSIDHYFNKRLSLSRVHAFGDMKSFKKLLSGVN